MRVPEQSNGAYRLVSASFANGKQLDVPAYAVLVDQQNAIFTFRFALVLEASKTWVTGEGSVTLVR